MSRSRYIPPPKFIPGMIRLLYLPSATGKRRLVVLMPSLSREALCLPDGHKRDSIPWPVSRLGLRTVQVLIHSRVRSTGNILPTLPRTCS